MSAFIYLPHSQPNRMLYVSLHQKIFRRTIPQRFTKPFCYSKTWHLRNSLCTPNKYYAKKDLRKNSV